MKIVKKISKFIALLLVLVTLLLIICPYLFKDKIIAHIRTAINQNIDAEVDFGAVNLSLIKDFPNLRVDIADIHVNGINEFEGYPLFQSKNAYVEIDIWSLIKEEAYRVKNIQIEEANIQIQILKNGKTNYDISKVATDTTGNETTEGYQLTLEKYSLLNSNIYYNDLLLDLSIAMQDLNHKGSGDFNQDVFDLTTETDIKSLTADVEGLTYLKNIHAKALAKINIDLPNQKYTLRDQQISLNTLRLNGDGDIQLAGDDILINADITAPKNEFKDFLSIIPNAYTKDFEKVQTKGIAEIKASIHGRYSAENNIYPLIKTSLNILDGYVQYPDLPQDVSNINMDLLFESYDEKLDRFLLNIPSMKLLIGNNPIAAKLKVAGSSNNPNIEGVMDGRLDLDILHSTLPLKDIQELSGIIDAQVSLSANYEDIVQNNISNIQFTGKSTAQNIQTKHKSYPSISIPDARLDIAPSSISLKSIDMKLGKSRVAVNAMLQNPLAYLIANQTMKANVNIQSEILDLDEWLAIAPEEENNVDPAAQANIALDKETEELLTNSVLDYSFEAKKMIYDDLEITNFKSKGSINANNIQIERLYAEANNSDVEIQGKLSNAYKYMYANDTLYGNIRLHSNNMNANAFLSEDTGSSTTDSIEIEKPIIPKNIDLKIEADIENLTYTNLDIKNINGSLKIDQGAMIMQDIYSETLGGQMSFDGVYNTINPEKPSFSMKYNLDKISFSETFKNILSIRQLSPIMEYIEGIFNATLVMEGEIGDNMIPDLSTLNASGYLETINGIIKGLEPIEKVVDKLGVSSLKEITLENTKNWFEISDGKIEVKEFDYIYNDIAMKISGNHSLTNDMKYRVFATIPRELLKSNSLTNIANTGLGFLEKEANKLGININQGEYINMDIQIGGSIASPAISVRPVSSAGNSLSESTEKTISENIQEAKDVAQQEVTDKIDQAKDSVQVVISEKTDSLKEEILSEASEMTSDVKDVVKDKISNTIDTTLTQVMGDSLTDKIILEADKLLEGKAQEEIDKVKDKLNNWNPFKKGNN